jgi:transposase
MAMDGPWQPVYSRFRRRRETGIWPRIPTAQQTESAHDAPLDNSLAMIDGSNIRAHQQAPGSAPKPQLLRGREGWRTMLQMVTERAGTPIVVALTAGQRHERQRVAQLAAGAGDQSRNPVMQRRTGVPQFDRDVYRWCLTIERTLNRLKRYRWIATSNDRLAAIVMMFEWG